MEERKSIKERIIYLFFQLLHHNVVTPTVYIAICYYESFLIIYYAMSMVTVSSLKESLNDVALIPYLIDESTKIGYYVIMTIFTSIHLFSPLILFFSLPQQDSVKNNEIGYLIGLMYKGASLYVTLLIRPFSVWLFEVYLDLLNCSKGVAYKFSDIQCWTGEHLAFALLGTLGFAAMIVELIFSAYLLPSDCYPESKQPWSGTMAYIGLPRIIVKLFIVLFHIMDFKYGIPILLIYLYFAIQRASCKQYIYNKMVFINNIVADAVVGIFALACSICAYLSIELTWSSSFLTVLISISFSGFCIAYNEYCLREIITIPISKLNSANEVSLYFVELITSCKNMLKSSEERMNVWSALCNHQNSCMYQTCECDFVEGKLKEICQTYLHVKEDHDGELEALKYKHTFIQKLLSVLLKDALHKWGESVEVRLLASYVEEKKLSNYIKGYYNIMKAEEYNPSLACELAILIHKQIIGSNIINKKQEQGLDVKGVWLFEKYYQMLLKDIEIGAKKCMDFWTELLQVSINLVRLYKKSIKISELYLKITNSIKQMLDIYPDHTRLLRDFSRFLSEVVNNDIEAAEYMERASNAAKIQSIVRADTSYEDTKYGYNSTTVTLAISANIESIGLVLNSNDRIRQFGYNKSEIIGNNISILMPAYLGSLHDSFISNYFNTGVSSLLNKEKILFVQNKAGYIKPIYLLVKCLPSLHEGLCFIGFMKKLTDESSYVQPPPKFRDKKVLFILTDSAGHLLGFTRDCFYCLGFVSGLIYKGREQREDSCFSIKDLNDSLLDPSYEAVLIKDGMECTFKLDSILNKVEFERLTQAEAKVMTDTVGTYRVFVQLIKHEYQHVSFRVYKLIVIKREKAHKCSSLMVSIGSEEFKSLYPSKMKEKSEKKEDTKKHKDLYAAQLFENSQETSTIHGSSTTGTSTFTKMMKEFKKQICNYTTPKSITYLNRGMIIILLLLIGVSLIDLVERLSFSTNFIAELKAICLSNNRRFLVADVSAKLRSAVNIAAGLEDDIFQNSSRMSRLIPGIKEDLTNLQQAQLQLDSHVFDISASTYKLLKTRSITVLTMDSNCDIETVNVTMSVAIGQLIMYIIQIVNGDMSTLANDPLPLLRYGQNSCTKATIIGRAIYFVIENGLGSIRTTTLAARQGYLDSAYSNSDRDEIYLLIIMGCEISFVILCIVIVVPVLVNAEKSKVIALSIYSQLPVEDAKKMLEKCRKYLKENEGTLHTSESNIDEDAKTLKGSKNSLELKREDSLAQNVSKIVAEKSKMLTETKEDKSSKKEDTCALIAKPPSVVNRIGHEETFKNFKTNLFEILVALFMITGAIFTYIMVCYYLTTVLFQESRMAFEQLIDITGRAPALVTGLSILRETFIRNITLIDGDMDLLDEYTERMRSIERSIKMAKNDMSVIIADSMHFLLKIDSPEMCNMATQSTTDQKACKEINGKVLLNGIKDAIYWYITMMITSKQQFMSLRRQYTPEAARKIVNSEEKVGNFIMKDRYINSIMWQLQDEIFHSTEEYYQNTKAIDITKGICFIVCILIIIGIIWSSFISGLTKEVFRARGILNLIPTDFVLNNDSIRKEVMKVISF